VGLATRRRALLTAAQRVVIDLIERLAVDPDLVPVGIHPVTGPTGGT
jgi:hypothetical protein